MSISPITIFSEEERQECLNFDLNTKKHLVSFLMEASRQLVLNSEDSKKELMEMLSKFQSWMATSSITVVHFESKTIKYLNAALKGDLTTEAQIYRLANRCQLLAGQLLVGGIS